jgi:hypothetical protein
MCRVCCQHTQLTSELSFCCCCASLLLAAVLYSLQAEAAAKLAQYQQGLRQLLSSIGKTGNIADDAQLLYKLADQLFGSPMNVCELLAQGGVPVILSATKSALQGLSGDAARVDMLPALMQVCSAAAAAACRKGLQDSLQETVLLLQVRRCNSGVCQWAAFLRIH